MQVVRSSSDLNASHSKVKAHMDTNEGLIEGYKKLLHLYSDESKWMQHYSARRLDGFPVESTDPSAVSWCLSGALYKLNLTERLFSDLAYHLPSKYDGSMVGFNDSSSFQEVRGLLRSRLFELSGYRPWSFMGVNFNSSTFHV